MHHSMRWIIQAGAMLMVAAWAQGATAQNTPSPPAAAPPAAPTTGVRGPFPAPVGHRQPRQSDVPADAVKQEQRGTPAERDLDSKLRICKGC
jgi:hypothetical protein